MIVRRIVLAGFAVALVTVTATAQASGDSSLQIGDRVRIKTPVSPSAVKGRSWPPMMRG